MVEINCNGLNSKWQSFDKIIHDLNPCAFFLQETKLPTKQPFKSNTNEYVIFRLEREKSGGGGLALGVIQDLNPILIRMGTDATEAIAVKVNINQFEIRLVVGYGAQESDGQAKLFEMSQVDRKLLLWDFLEVEVREAEHMEQGLIIQIDANSHLGPDMIKGDPNPRNQNGKMFAEFLERNPAIFVVNSSDKCKGIITRKRKHINRVEESVIDFFLVNQKMAQYITQMVIDEDDLYTLSNIAQKKPNRKTIKSDHRTLILDLDLHFSKIKPDTQEFFNFKSEIRQEKFKNITDNEIKLVECLNNDLPIDAKAKIWQKTLDNVFHKAFTKVKVKTVRKNLIQKRQSFLKSARL